MGVWPSPRAAQAVVVFAHGSGSGRFSPRNQFVARVLQESRLGTLLIDLLEEDEAVDRSRVFDIGVLTDRLQAATDWLAIQPEVRGKPLGYFGASTGAAAALRAAARKPGSVAAIVSRGGRPDLARESLSQVTAPTLLIVGGDDEIVVDLNREAYGLLKCSEATRYCSWSQSSVLGAGRPGRGCTAGGGVVPPLSDSSSGVKASAYGGP